MTYNSQAVRVFIYSHDLRAFTCAAIICTGRFARLEVLTSPGPLNPLTVVVRFVRTIAAGHIMFYRQQYTGPRSSYYTHIHLRILKTACFWLTAEFLTSYCCSIVSSSRRACPIIRSQCGDNNAHCKEEFYNCIYWKCRCTTFGTRVNPAKNLLLNFNSLPIYIYYIEAVSTPMKDKTRLTNHARLIAPCMFDY